MSFLISYHAILIGALLLHQALGEITADGHPRRGLANPLRMEQEESIQSILQRFKDQNQLSEDFDVEQNMQEISGTSFSLGGETISFDISNDLTPIDIFTTDATYSLEGVSQPLPATAVFRSNSHPSCMITLVDGRFLGASMIDPTTGMNIELVSLAPDSSTFVTVTTADLDEEKLSAFIYGNDVIQDRRRERTLRDAFRDEGLFTNYKEKHHDDDVRLLQSCPSPLRQIEVAIAYESKFCNQFGNGNADTANSKVQSIVARTKTHYKDICIDVVVSHLEANCISGSDPYRGFVKDNADVCGILASFTSYWNSNRKSIQRDVTHLFFGSIKPDGGVIGCAYVRQLCNSQSYGVDEIGFTTGLIGQSVLFSHEFGHNAGSDHDTTAGQNIMSPQYCPCETFSSSSDGQINSYLNQATCVPGTGPPGTPPPIFGGLCFSGVNTVEVQGKGLVSMEAVQIGDYVRAGKHRFSRVYGFIHLDRNVEAVEYLQIYAHGLTSPLEITPDHMVFVNNAPVRASQAKIGDLLGESKIVEIKSVKRRGAYAPITESGDIIVSGVLASSYAAILSHTPANQHFGAHAFFSLRRLVCAFNFEICESETYTNGYPDWLSMSTIHFFMITEAKHPAVQVVATFAFLPFITAAYIMEQILLSPFLVILLVLGIFAFKWTKTCKVKVQ